MINPVLQNYVSWNYQQFFIVTDRIMLTVCCTCYVYETLSSFTNTTTSANNEFMQIPIEINFYKYNVMK